MIGDPRRDPARLVFVLAVTAAVGASRAAVAFVRRATAAFGHGLALAAPIVLASLVGNLAFAVINRAEPAVNVFSIALAAVLVPRRHRPALHRRPPRRRRERHLAAAIDVLAN